MAARRDYSLSESLRLHADRLSDQYWYYGHYWGLTPADVDARFSPGQRAFYFEHWQRRRELDVDDQILAIIKGVGRVMGDKLPPWISEQTRWHLSLLAAKDGEFPYDVPYLKDFQVKQLLGHSKPYCLSQIALFSLEQTIPAPLLARLRQLQGIRCTAVEWNSFVNDAIGEENRLLYRQALDTAGRAGLHSSVPIWTPERAAAHLQTADGVARRCSVTLALWNRYQHAIAAGRRVTLEHVREWVQQDALTALVQNFNAHCPVYLQDAARVAGMTPQQFWERRLKAQGVQLEALRREHFAGVKRLA